MMKNKSGRPTKMTQGTVKKLEEAFLRGLSDEEACLYANISKPTLYDYCKKNPQFTDRKELLKQRIKTRAKLNISKAIEDGDIDLSKWYLERKDDEFKTKTKLEHDGMVSVAPHNPFEDLTVEELRAIIAEDAE
ncbi:hypothetical protein [Streptococcus suis]|uniref:hypothetical protein n=1 Tax=Streptococcus suis TaxID=1307 RepID=UPI00041B06B5|nr:hypothetical protein [Streptococcus suis]